MYIVRKIIIKMLNNDVVFCKRYEKVLISRVFNYIGINKLVFLKINSNKEFNCLRFFSKMKLRVFNLKYYFFFNNSYIIYFNKVLTELFPKVISYYCIFFNNKKFS